MKNIAIKGHSTRGKEIIRILENLGDISSDLHGTLINQYYFIMDNTNIVASSNKKDFIDCIVYDSLEEYENSKEVKNLKQINYTDI